MPRILAENRSEQPERAGTSRNERRGAPEFDGRRESQAEVRANLDFGLRARTEAGAPRVP